MKGIVRWISVLLFASASLVACDDKDSTRETAADMIPDEVLDYFGQFEPTVAEAASGTYRTFRFPNGAAEGGPACIKRGDFEFSMRDGTSNNLHVFFQGGGACWSEVCLPTNSASASMPSGIMSILSAKPAKSPVANFTTIYVPYCDGSLFAGDAEYGEPGDSDYRLHRGVQNLTAVVEAAMKHTPNPDKIFISGLSAGGFGTVFASLMFRKAFPYTPIYVFNDSGIGILRGDVDPTLIRRLITEWNIDRFVPAICEEEQCLDSGHMMKMVDLMLRIDKNLRISMYTTRLDAVIAGTFLGLPGDENGVGAYGPPQFEEAVLEELPKMEVLHPDRFRYVIAQGGGHTTFGGVDVFKAGPSKTLKVWLEEMLNHESGWESWIEP